MKPLQHSRNSRPRRAGFTPIGPRGRAALVTALLIACSGETSPEFASSVDRFAGSDSCRDCHPGSFAAWHGSPHDRALDEATPATVLGDFDDVDFEDGEIRARFTRNGREFHVETRGADGDRALFEVAYVIGIDPLQQLVIEEPPGQLQAFSVGWDTRAQRWLALHPAADAMPGDWLHWTGGAFNANSMCIECHATNVEVGFRTGSQDYETTWSEGDVACEACHGPSATHVSQAHRKREGPRGIAGAQTAVQDRDRERQQAELASCAPCHSRRRRSHVKPATDESFDDRYSLELVREGLYYADGQILGEVYVLGSFLQSRMYAEGVRCTHCHDPHTLQLVAEGNDLCLKCHETRYDTRSHHHHEQDSPGGRCIECHMRARTYMQVDPRRDHGFHLPRPDQSVEFGVPNACNDCHPDRDANWARDRVIAWYGPRRPHDIHATAAFAADRMGSADADRLLAQVYDDPATPPILRATALERLAARGATQRRRIISSGLASALPMLRSTAVAATESLSRAERSALLAPLVSDASRGVRTEAARILGSLEPQRLNAPGDESDRALSYAFEEYLAIQRSLGSQPGAKLNLAIADAQRGRFDAAEGHYLRALALDSDFLPARFNLALLYDGQDRGGEAEAQLRAALETDPELGEAHYSLGLLLAADPARKEETAESLAAAARSLPQRPRVQYNAGLAQQRLGRGPEAEAFLQEAMRLEPANADFRIALAILAAQRGRWSEARTQAERFVAEHPRDPRGATLLLRVREQANPSH